jgi:hypothetical protein
MITDYWQIVGDKAGWVHQTAKGWRIVFWHKWEKSVHAHTGKAPQNFYGGAHMLGTYDAAGDAEKMFALLAAAGTERICSVADIDKVRKELSGANP